MDPRVILRERTNLRHLTASDLYGPEDPWPDLAVVDVSFISLLKTLPAVRGLLRPAADAGANVEDLVEAVLLVKPQFEVGRERISKGGVVRDPGAHLDAIDRDRNTPPPGTCSAKRFGNLPHNLVH